MKKPIKKTIFEDNIIFDSREELHVYWWLKELKDNGFINEIIAHPEAFHLSGKFVSKYIKPMKRVKDKIVEKTILHPHEYTCDFYVTWNFKEAHGVFVNNEFLIDKPVHQSAIDLLKSDYGRCWIEVKPSFDQNNMTRLAVINQKWVLDKHGCFVNIVKPEALFAKTFTPKRYLIGDLSKKPRKIKFEIKSLNEFLNKQS